MFFVDFQAFELGSRQMEVRPEQEQNQSKEGLVIEPPSYTPLFWLLKDYKAL